MDAERNPVTRKYTRREVNTNDMPIEQKPDIDLSVDKPVQHGEVLVDVVGEVNDGHMEKLAFMEEPVTIRIEENSRSDFPETCVPVAVQGKGAEVFTNGKWVEITWLPIGIPLVTKRKYVEVLARAKSDAIRTKHDNATVERPCNTVERRTSANYPLSIIEDRNPKGHEWLSGIMRGH